MIGYKSQQKNMVSRLESSFAAGKSKSTVVSMVRDYFDDDQICLTSIARVSSEVCDEIIKNVIEPLRQVEPEHFYYPPESMHLTIKNIRTINQPPHFTQGDVEKTDRIFSEIIPKYEAFECDVKDVVLFPTSISVMIYTDIILQKLVTELDREMNKAGVPDDKKYFSNKVFWGNITVCRLTKTPSQEFIDEVKMMRNLRFGQFNIDKISLVTANVVLNPKYLKVIGKYNLK